MRIFLAVLILLCIVLIVLYLKRRRPVEKLESSDKNYDRYIVAIVDILGQSEKLAHLEIDPAISRESEEFKRFKLLFNETFGVVIDFRESIKNLNDLLAKESEKPEFIPLAYSERYRKCSKANVSCDFFSDLAILSICLTKNFAVSASLSSLFVNLSLLFLNSLAKGVPLRGAIDVGQGMKMDEGDIYGSGLNRAYKLERDEADYPRIVFGRTFINYFEALSKMDPDTFEKARNLDILESLKPYIEEDSDGEYILSYLASRFIEGLGGSNSSDLLETLTMASEFIQSEIDKYSSEIDKHLDGNGEELLNEYKKRLNRYTKVRDYFIRKDCWKL